MVLQDTTIGYISYDYSSWVGSIPHAKESVGEAQCPVFEQAVVEVGLEHIHRGIRSFHEIRQNCEGREGEKGESEALIRAATVADGYRLTM